MTFVSALLLALATQPGDAAILQVGDVSLHRDEVAARAAEYLRTAGTSIAPEQFLEGLLDEVALAAEARRSGTAATPRAQAAVALGRSEALARAFWERELLAKATPTAEQLRTFLHDTRDTVRLTLVVLGTREEAAGALARVAQGGSLEAEATRSLHRSASARGDTGPITRGALEPALAKVAFSVPIGQLFGPVDLENGVAVGRVAERTLADEAALVTERAALEPWVRKQIATSVKLHLLDLGRRQSVGPLDERFLASLERRTTSTPAEADHVVVTIFGQPVRYRELEPEIEKWAGGGGHMFGPSVRIRVANQFIDNALLAAAATKAGLPTDPAVAPRLKASELTALARVQASAIAASAPTSATPAQREQFIAARVATLRSQLTVQLDRAATLAAIQASPAPAPAR